MLLIYILAGFFGVCASLYALWCVLGFAWVLLSMLCRLAYK